ncbi:MAG: DUF3048 domain-containing protein [Oscillospiraceae bacterium]|jgi:hypothetical protein|nr:DUF3048 domain-containing protein [Oscillospiraceae bacterium]
MESEKSKTAPSAQQNQVARRRRIIALCIALLLVAVTTVIVLAAKGVFDRNPPVLPPVDLLTQAPTDPPDTTLNPFTGLHTLDPAAYGKRPASFMVNNAPAARPQWGLCAPDIITETLVEGGITRMLFMFADVNTVPKIGPIRSARHDFVEIAEGFDSFLFHWGGSPQAYSAIKARNVNSLDGMVYAGKYFFRDAERRKRVALEHTAYTNGEAIAGGIADQKWRTELDTAKKEPFTFVEESASARVPAGGTANTLQFRYSGSYQYAFAYDAATGLYAQSLNQKPFVQEGGEQRKVTNIVLIYTNVQAIPNDKKNRVNIDMKGGAGLYITAGGWEAIRWVKGEPNDPLQLLDSAGEPLKLNRGKGYIGMVPLTEKSHTAVG